MREDIELLDGPSDIKGGVRRPSQHDSAHKHVSGEAIYIDDIPELPNTLQIYIAQSPKAHARILSLDVSAVEDVPGVAIVLTHEDIPGINDYSPVMGDDPIFAEKLVEYVGQSIFAVAAINMDIARAAAKLAVVEYEELDAILTIDEAMKAKSFVLDTNMMVRGDARGAILKAKNKLKGSLSVGGQEHFYLEGQLAYAIPEEDGDVKVYSSTQHPSEVQHNVAKALAVPDNAVTIEIRRMGGGFGGKESQPALLASIAALVATKTNCPAKLRLDRDDDMIMTGKRHGLNITYDVGFDADGRIKGVVFDQMVNCGMSCDLSGAIADRAMFHADNSYYLDNALITSYRCKTNTVSNTAFRGFGGPQGMVCIERVIDEIASFLKLDALAVRRVNYYGGEGRNITPYEMTVEDCVIDDITDELVASSDYEKRWHDIRAFNETSPIIKRGIALTPVKFGISFTTTFLNQAGALVHVYTDGSVKLNHGGVEMGQGLYTKVAQVVAEIFQIDLDKVKITSTTTDKVPNTSATAASSGTDMNGMAAKAAAETIKGRLIDFAVSQYGVAREAIVFDNNRVMIGDRVERSFAELAKEAYMARVSLSSTGFYKTPKIHYDKETMTGRPFYYFAYGAAVSEVEIDTLTGENRMRRVDILHDCGKSLNPVIDLGQIEGAFIQGAGWLTTEELFWDNRGALKTHAPSTYKIPTCSDRPEEFNVNLWQGGKNVEDTIFKSKAVGEPPLMLGIATWLALSDAVASVGDYKIYPNLNAPATPEEILMQVDRLREIKDEAI